jgi:hypothetical protein
MSAIDSFVSCATRDGRIAVSAKDPRVRLSASTVHAILRPVVDDDDFTTGNGSASPVMDADVMNRLHLYRMCYLPGVDRDTVSALYRQVPPPTFADAAAILGVDADWLREQE